jgi:Ca2+-binding EF-hand superfamily protein
MTWFPKKTEKLEVRLSTETKQAFLARCRSEGRSASETLRGFIDDYLARPLSPQELKMIARSPFTYAGLAVAAVVGVAIVGAAQPSHAQPDLTGFFKSLDRNGDGRLTRDEFGTSGPPPAPKPGQGVITIGGQFPDYDTNQDGVISLAEFTAFNQASILKRFLALDADSDGKLTLAEVQRPGALLGDRHSGMAISGAITAKGFARVDKNHDGAISRAEFGVRP